MNLLTKFAERLNVPPSTILATRKDDPKSLAVLESETERALEKTILDRDSATKTVKTLTEALGETDESKAVAKVIDLLKAAADLAKLKPELDALEKSKKEAEEAAIANDVEEVMAASQIPDAAKAAMLHLRRSSPVEFAEKYPKPAKPPKGHESIAKKNLTGSNPRPAAAAGSGGDDGDDGKPKTPKELVGFKGTNDLEKAIACVRSKDGGANLSNDAAFKAGMELLSQLRGVG